jgi:hypothetical protein
MRASRVVEARKKMPLALALEVMMIDAINIYVRTVLVARGHMTREGHEAAGSRDCIEAKYAVVRELATKCAVFDGYEREPPMEQSQAEQLYGLPILNKNSDPPPSSL